MRPEHAEWLSRRTEAAIDPDVPVVDPHHHLWPERRGDTYLLPELHADTGAGHNVVGTVFVECASEYRSTGPPALRPVGETEFVAAQAAQARDSDGAPIAGIVSFADLSLGDAVEEVLRAHEAAGDGLFRGIRHATGWHADERIPNSHSDPGPQLMADPNFRRGFARLGAMGHRFDAWLYHPQLPELVDLARAHPEVPIVLDHLGAPMGIGPYQHRRNAVIEEWRPPMEDLAACDNVVLKVGGIGMQRYYGGGWTERPAPPSSEELADHWADVVHWCIDVFGPDRCLLESNFPVDRETCDYAVLWNALKRLVARFDERERAAMLHDNAVRVYGLDLPETVT